MIDDIDVDERTVTLDLNGFIEWAKGQYRMAQAADGPMDFAESPGGDIEGTHDIQEPPPMCEVKLTHDSTNVAVAALDDEKPVCKPCLKRLVDAGLYEAPKGVDV